MITKVDLNYYHDNDNLEDTEDDTDLYEIKIEY